MALKEFEEFLEEPLVLPIGGKHYTIPPVGAQEGVLLSALFESTRTGATTDLDDDSEVTLYKRVLGPAFDQLLEDNVPTPALVLAGKTALILFLHGRTVAEKFWNAGGNPAGEARAAKKAAPKPRAKRPARSTSTNTVEETTTPSPDSTSGTSSRKAPSTNP